MEIVVVDERDPAGEHRIGGAAVDLLQVVLAGLVGGMRLAGKHDLHRPARRVEDAEQPIGVVEDQLGPLVAGEPAREADGQRVRIEQRAGGDDARRADVLFLPARARALADEREQVVAQRLPRGPELLVRDLEDARPRRPDRRGGRASPASR